MALDAGPFWDPTADWVSDELGSHHLYWTEPRVISGTDPVPLGSNNSGRGVGGSMIHYAGYTPRFHPSDFETHTRDGVGADWPISYGDLKSYYEDIEHELPVSGQPWPWGDPHRYPYSPQPLGGNGDIFLRGAHALGIDARIGPVAIANGRFGNRPHCIYRGFCLQGCKVNAKASPLITHIPDALAHGAEIRANAMVTRVTTDDQGRATGVVYLKEGVEHHQAARLVVVAGYSIETPRLLLLSASSRFPDGLCNDYGQVGRYVMVQGAPQVAGRFDDEVRMYKAPPPEVSSEHFYETDPTKPYQRGYSIQNVSPLPITYAEHVSAQGHWGEVLREYMRDYNHWAALGALCEFLPRWENSVTLADENDRNGLPVANFSYSQCDNDRALMAAAQQSAENILRAGRGQRDHRHRPVRPPRRRLSHGHQRTRRRRQPRPAELRRPEPLPRRRQRPAHPGSGQPGAHHHGPGRPLRRPADRHSSGRCTATRSAMSRPDTPIGTIDTEAYRIPTDQPEADGTLTWSSTTLILARITAGDTEGIGWTYADVGAKDVIDGTLGPLVTTGDPAAVPELHEDMVRACRNLGRPGEVSCAISAVDIALWDLKARLLDLPLADLWGRA